MGATVGSKHDKRSVDVELNVVPFIDLMSCLTAFLLVTAVWSQYASIDIEPAGIGRQGEVSEPLEVVASVLITENDIWLGVTNSAFNPVQISAVDGRHDYTALADFLSRARRTPHVLPRLEVAAEDDVVYQEIVNTMDTALAASFQIGLVDPMSLSFKFKE